MEQLEANLRTIDVRLTEDDLERLDGASATAPTYPGRFLDTYGQR